jgi:Double zinc ribbon
MTTLSSAFGSVHSALHSTPFVIAGNLTVFLAIVFWLGLAFWIFRDSRRRLRDPWLVGIATLLGLVVPYLGALIYLLFRPPETLAEVRARELEVRALAEHIGDRDERCPVCRTRTEPGFLVCPVCATRLRQPCVQCGVPLDPLWQICPYCATPATSPPALEPVAEDLDAALAREPAARHRRASSRSAAS